MKLTHLGCGFDVQGPETRECLEAVDMSRQDLVSRIDDYKLNRGPSPDPFEGLIEQLEKFVEAPSTKRGHDVSRFSSDMVGDNSFGEEVAVDLNKQTNQRNVSPVVQMKSLVFGLVLDSEFACMRAQAVSTWIFISRKKAHANLEDCRDRLLPNISSSRGFQQSYEASVGF